jgi:NAD+--dinitrogen-reductase ADP-D-ribosyltransferase
VSRRPATQKNERPCHSTNLVGVPAALLASPIFNAHPVRLSINGVRETNAALFRMLADSTSIEESMEAFQNYTGTLFGLDGMAEPQQRGVRRFRSSYLRLLQGWGFDANNAEGAVLKGWVESRFGLPPTFHKEPLVGQYSIAGIPYLEEKMSSRFHNNSINLQLDLLYEYGQYMIRRFNRPSRHKVKLWRGVNDFVEQRIVEGSLRNRECVVRLNNLVSFSFSRERADEFGAWILEAEVPVVKLLFFNDLLPQHPLKGEGEALVIGGDYLVSASYV